MKCWSLPISHWRMFTSGALGTPRSVGHRCLARGLSDIAAMGGQTLRSVPVLGVACQATEKWVDAVLAGLLTLAKHTRSLWRRRHAQSPGLRSSRKFLVDIVVVGSAPRGKSLRRSGAKPGGRDLRYWQLGASALGSKRFLPSRKRNSIRTSILRHFYPQPRLAIDGICANIVSLVP